MLSLFENSILTRKDGSHMARGKDVIQDKKVALYFVSCSEESKKFTQKLKIFYKLLLEKGEKNLEIIFIPCDIRKTDRKKCMKHGHQSWSYLQVEYPAMIILQELFKIKSLPCLLIFDESHRFFNENGIEFVNSFLKMLDVSHTILDHDKVLAKSLSCFLSWRFLFKFHKTQSMKFVKMSKKSMNQSRSQFYVDLTEF